jgi:hypothetical protein
LQQVDLPPEVVRWRGASTMRKLAVGVGSLLVIFGITFGLQGLDVIGGSTMSGKTVWALLGPLIALVGLGLIVGGRRGRNGADAR